MGDVLLPHRRSKAAFTPGQHVARQHVANLPATCVLLPSTCCLLSAIKLLPDCCPSVAGFKGVQVDRDINEQ